MNAVRNFSEFVKENIVKKQHPDLSRAIFLLKESEKAHQFIMNAIKKIGVDDNSANSIIKLSYDAIMDLIRAEMLTHGYNAVGQGAHQAEVAYLREIGFNENDIQFADQLRYFRNAVIYYGKILDKEYAEKVLDFMDKSYPRLIGSLGMNSKKEIKIPTRDECIKLLKANNVPANIIAHTSAVCDFSMKVCDILERKSIKVNRDLVAAAALLHDIKKLEPGEHEIEGAKYIESLGYPEVGKLIKKHGLKRCHLKEFYPVTWEEKIIFYSDKRVKNNKVVSVDERFEYIKQTYFRPAKDLNKDSGSEILQTATNASNDTCGLQYNKQHVEKEIKLTKDIEKELLGNGKIE